MYFLFSGVYSSLHSHRPTYEGKALQNMNAHISSIVKINRFKLYKIRN